MISSFSSTHFYFNSKNIIQNKVEIGWNLNSFSIRNFSCPHLGYFLSYGHCTKYFFFKGKNKIPACQTRWTTFHSLPVLQYFSFLLQYLTLFRTQLKFFHFLLKLLPMNSFLIYFLTGWLNLRVVQDFLVNVDLFFFSICSNDLIVVMRILKFYLALLLNLFVWDTA